MSIFGFPHIQREDNFHYKHNLLQSVIFQINYQKNEKILEQKDNLVKVFGEEFSNIKSLNQTKGEIQILPGGTPVLGPASLTANGFELRSKDNLKVLVVTLDSLVLTVAGKAYRSSGDIYKIFTDQVIPFLESIGISQVQRVSIRKINVVEAAFSDEKGANYESIISLLGAIFNSQLIANFQFLPVNSGTIENGINSSSIKLGNYSLLLKNGILPLKSKNTRQVLLDIDTIKNSPSINIKNLIEEFRIINEEIFDIFNWALQKEFIKSLGGGNGRS